MTWDEFALINVKTRRIELQNKTKTKRIEWKHKPAWSVQMKKGGRKWRNFWNKHISTGNILGVVVLSIFFFIDNTLPSLFCPFFHTLEINTSFFLCIYIIHGQNNPAIRLHIFFFILCFTIESVIMMRWRIIIILFEVFVHCRLKWY